jgi:hypothetical protein
MDLGPVRSAVAGVTQPTPPAPEPAQTVSRPDLDRARAVVASPTVDYQPAGYHRSRSVPLASLPPAAGQAAPAPAADSDGEDAAPARVVAPVTGYDNVQRRFDLDDSSKQLVFRMIDVSTGEVVRQFPHEDRLRLREMLRAFGANALGGGNRYETSA